MKIFNRHSVTAQMIKWSVPFLNIFRNPAPWPYSLDELSHMDPGTLGNELYLFLSSRDLGYLPKYEIHDAYHALLGYSTTVTEEIRLQAFMWGNGNSTFAGRVLLILGFIIFPGKHHLLRADYRKGKRAKPLKDYPVATMIPKDIHQLRAELCIELS